MELQVKNYMEELVFEYMDDLLKGKDDVCKCNQCLLDIATYALNQLPPKYFSRPKGMVFSRLEEFENQIRADIISVLIKGIEMVRKDPQHNNINEDSKK